MSGIYTVEAPQHYFYFTSLNQSAAKKRTGYFLVFSLIAVSGIEFFYRSQEYILIAFLISLLVFALYKKKVHKHFLWIAGLFLIIEVFQYSTLGGFNFRTFTGTYIRLFLAYSVVAFVGVNFFYYYVKILYFLSVISLVFYFGSFLPEAENFYINVLANLIQNPFEADNSFYSGSPNVVIVTFNSLFTEYRNSGPFWEPGAFAVFLMLGLLFNQIIDKRITSKINVVFIISLLTTISTSGFIAFFIFLFYVNYQLLTSNILYLYVFIAFIFGAVLSYNQLPFLKTKIEQNIYLADETTTSRFGSAIADFESFQEKPLIGYGRAGARDGFSMEFDVTNHRNNGIFNLLSTYGLPITLVYFYLILKTFRRLQQYFNLSFGYSTCAFAILLVLGFSQGLFLRPFFYSFLFLPIVFKVIKFQK